MSQNKPTIDVRHPSAELKMKCINNSPENDAITDDILALYEQWNEMPREDPVQYWTFEQYYPLPSRRKKNTK